ncbi:MAG: formate dehydrogenase subunit delta [Burkholderiales bacterium]|nr:formate dehydrogenase subunit delta [Burkholderiales bacterium]MDE2288608.1 formate dehydrogenase subunit delta [Burkholderiales bacterium]MDE2609657.1 formate dehydrogenase subunit delta [Burkholderiales bacterium]
MNGRQLITMANQIGGFFASMPDHTQALADIASHIRRSWEPRMRRQILAMLDTPEAESMSAIVREALQAHRASLTPPQK